MKSNYERFKEYCPNCDRSLVGNGFRCVECGVKSQTKKEKKPSKYDLMKSYYEDKEDEYNEKF